MRDAPKGPLDVRELTVAVTPRSYFDLHQNSMLSALFITVYALGPDVWKAWADTQGINRIPFSNSLGLGIMKVYRNSAGRENHEVHRRHCPPGCHGCRD